MSFTTANIIVNAWIIKNVLPSLINQIGTTALHCKHMTYKKLKKRYWKNQEKSVLFLKKSINNTKQDHHILELPYTVCAPL